MGTDKYYNKAFEWYFKSSNNDYLEGYYHLGRCYYYGIGTEVNINQAVIQYEKASNSGIKGANVELNKILSQNDK